MPWRQSVAWPGPPSPRKPLLGASSAAEAAEPRWPGARHIGPWAATIVAAAAFFGLSGWRQVEFQRRTRGSPGPLFIVVQWNLINGSLTSFLFAENKKP